jgi:hypothetical protein
MIDFDHSLATTKPRAAAKPMYLGFVAAVAFSSTLPNCIDRVSLRHLDRFHGDACSATANFDLDAFSCQSASTKPKAFTHGEAADALRQLLAKNGFNPSRIERTADDSILFQFLGKVRACIDLYPNGELIVVLRQSGRDEIHELQYEDSDRLIHLMRDAAVTS